MTKQRVSSGSPLEPVFGFCRAVRTGKQIMAAGTAPQPSRGTTALLAEFNLLELAAFIWRTAMTPRFAFGCCAVLALAACSETKQPAPLATSDAVDTAPAMPEASMMPRPSASPPEAEKSIPLALRGRWGLVAADCTSTRGDAKGLITISADSVRYYESLAKLSKVTERSDTSLAAGFAFSGEGMEWQRNMTLKLQDGGKTLVKQEFGADAIPGPLTYRHCS